MENAKEETQEKETLPKTEETVEETQKKPTSIIEEAKLERLRLEKDIEILKTERLKLEELEVNRKLGGESGSIPPADKPKEISDKEYAEKALSGELNVTKE